MSKPSPRSPERKMRLCGAFGRKPCYVKDRGLEGGSFTRTHDGDHRLSSYEIHVLMSGRGRPLDEVAVIEGARRSDLDDGLVAVLLARIRQKRGPALANADDDDDVRGQRSGAPRLPPPRPRSSGAHRGLPRPPPSHQSRRLARRAQPLPPGQRTPDVIAQLALGQTASAGAGTEPRARIRELPAGGPRPTRTLAEAFAMTPQGALRQLRKMEETGEVELTEPARRSPLNRWRLTNLPDTR